MYKTSSDNGNNWSSSTRLPNGILGPIKNKPIQLENGTIISPSSTEIKNKEGLSWKIHVEISDDDGTNWKKIPIDQKTKFDVIQPSVLIHDEGKLQLLCRSRDNSLMQAYSYDDGLKWGKVTRTKLPNPNSGTDAITMKNGYHLLVYNPLKNGGDDRKKLSVAVSKNGIDWEDQIILEEKKGLEFSYPAVIESSDGKIHISYTYDRKNIKHVILTNQIMESIDLIVFLAYLIFILLLSFFFYKKKRSAKSFILGHGNIPNWVVSMSIFATFVSSISYLALPGSSFNSNWNPFVFSLSIPLASVMAIKFFVPIYRGMKSTSAYFYLEKRFGLWARIYASLCYILTQIVRVGTILYLLAISLNFILGWKINMVIILTGVFVLIYSLLGGITAVLWTDAIQGIILIIGAIVCLILIHLKMPDGPSQIYDIAFNDDKFSLGSFSTSFTESTFWVVFMESLLTFKTMELIKITFNAI